MEMIWLNPHGHYIFQDLDFLLCMRRMLQLNLVSKVKHLLVKFLQVRMMAIIV